MGAPTKVGHAQELASAVKPPFKAVAVGRGRRRSDAKGMEAQHADDV